jgi:hypothetical protein
MKLFIKLLALSLLLITNIQATKVDDDIASKLARDSYLDKNEFASLHKTANNTIITATASGVRYFTIEDDENTIVVIRGTANIRNAITDVMAADVAFLDDEFAIVHKGFYNVATKIFKKIKLDKSKPIILVGHSLGGAVSLLYGAMLKEMKLDVTLYTFGMPPIANKLFLKKYQELEHNRHFHIFDPVSSLSKPTIQLFQTQMKFKSFQSAKDTISNMIDTIKNVPDKFRHHGDSFPITDKLDISEEKLNKSLFFKTCTLYFDYHKIDNYIYAITKNLKESLSQDSNHNTGAKVAKVKPKQKPKKVRIIPSVTKGTTPLEVEFYVDAQNVDIALYYFNFAGKEVLKQELKNNKISHTFTRSGKHQVAIALKDINNNIVETTVTISTRQPTFQEYQDAIGKEFMEFKNNY